MTFVSYAQNYEDVTLLRALGHVDRGFYIDVGAHDPVVDSVTKAFYERGWRGINIEPIAEWHHKVVADRPGDINLNVAIGAEAGVIKLHEVVGTGMTTSKPQFAALHGASGFEVRDVRVPAITLDTVWTDCGVTEVHFLKIDVEGAEGEVLKGLSLRIHRPWIILLEATLPNSMDLCHQEWESLLTDRGYAFAYFDGLNRFYIADEHLDALRGRLSLPPNFFDRFEKYADHEARQLGARVAAERDALAAERDALAAERDALAAERDTLAAERNALAIRSEGLDAEVVRVQAQCDAQGTRVGELERELSLAQAETLRRDAEVDALREQVAGLETRIAELTASAVTRNAQLATLENELTSTRTAAASDRNEAFHYRARAVVVENELRGIHASWSWRLTRVLREGNVAAKRMLRPVLEASLHGTRRSPLLKSAIWKAASISPRIEAKVRRFAHSRPIERASVAPAAADGVRPQVAADSGRQMLVPHKPWTPPPAPPVEGRVLYLYVDHTVRCPVNTGVQRVTRGLSEALLRMGERVRFVKWDGEHQRLVLASREDLAHLSLWQGPAVERDDLATYPPSSAAGVPVGRGAAADGSWLVMPEVTYINYHDKPLTVEIVMAAKRLGLRTVFTFYDAIPLRRPEMKEIAPLHEAYMRALLMADLVLPISRWSGVELASFFTVHECALPLSSPKIVPIQIPGESTLSQRTATAVPTDSRMILSVGTMETRKNQITLIEAFERLAAARPDDGLQLVLVGNIHPSVAREIEAARQRTPAIHIAGNIGDDELRGYYDACALTVFPSLDEGFGLPILESLWHAKPCICANFGAMAEIAAGGGCVLVDTRDASEVQAAMGRLLDDGVERARLQQEAATRALRTWPEYAAKVLQEIDAARVTVQSVATIYYCIDHTCTFPYNTGIQRVVRGLGRALIELGFKVVPVKWDPALQRIHAPTLGELEHLEKWNGPAKWGWAHGDVPETFQPGDWLLMPELTAYPGGPDLRAIKAYSVVRRIRTAWIFYDTIPWKMRELYNDTVSGLHRDYLERLNEFELVLSISKFSRDDLRGFLSEQPFRTIGLEQRVVACPLPGEFRETTRVTHPKAGVADSIVILSVGSVEVRKNHLSLLRAFVKAAPDVGRPMSLRLVGGCHLPAEREREFRALLATMPSVTWEETADDTTLRRHYAECDFTVYPSIEEGFGLPILESLWNGRPCICRDSGAMAEVAEGGGCIAVETRDVDALADALRRLANDDALRLALANEAVARPFKTWREYGEDVIGFLADERFVPGAQVADEPLVLADHFREMVNLAPRPLLSICITTYNRGPWLAVALRNLVRLLPQPLDEVELVVCDNASTDETPEVVQEYLGRPDFRYYRNAENVGMLGNLSVTAHHARGRHVWIVGDDDLLKVGAIERVLAVVKASPDIALVYLNYAYTHEDKAEGARDLDEFLRQGTPIVAPGPDIHAPVREISTKSENFFTAIYCLVFRRDHALRAYSQDTSGRPFSTMLTCIPTTHYVLHYMMDEPACWIGEPQLVVNMNVSWIRYAPVWILERLPEMFDLAERMGADPMEVDRWRLHSLTNVFIYFEQILTNDPIGNAELFDARRLVTRYKHLEPFRDRLPRLRQIYDEARRRGAVGTDLPTESVFKAAADEPVPA